MAKAASLKLVPQLSSSQMSQGQGSRLQSSRLDKSETLANVKQNVEEAVSLLRSLGKDYEKAAWMLEDSLNFALPDTDRADTDRADTDRASMFSDDLYATQGVDWASLIQAEELFEASR